MNNPYLVAFISAEGVQLGAVIRWINKLWLVRLRNGQSCFVSPCQVLWIE
jgi:hypothetical protein